MACLVIVLGQARTGGVRGSCGSLFPCLVFIRDSFGALVILVPWWTGKASVDCLFPCGISANTLVLGEEPVCSLLEWPGA